MSGEVYEAGGGASRAWRIVRAVLFTRHDRWDWLLSLAVLLALVVGDVDRVLAASVGVVLGLQSSRAGRAWRRWRRDR
jgi:hypothetical protein